MSLPKMQAANRIRLAGVRSLYLASPRKCLGCNSDLPYKARDNKFCGHSCSARHANNGIARNGRPNPWCGKSRPCAFCGKTVAQYTQKYCSRTCSKKGLYVEFIENWKAGIESGLKGLDSVSTHIVKYLREKFGSKCRICGWCEVNQHTGRIPIQVHHIDGDPRNMKEENLDLLCPNCHSLTETFGSRNKGRGRDSRKAWRRKKDIAAIAQMAERDLAKVEVPGS